MPGNRSSARAGGLHPLVAGATMSPASLRQGKPATGGGMGRCQWVGLPSPDSWPVRVSNGELWGFLLSKPGF